MSASAESPALPRLDPLAVIEFAGEDALSFLNGQLSNDVAGLVTGEQQLAALNNPKGRVVAILTLERRPDRVLAALPGELAAPVLERLRKYVLRARVTLREASDLAAFGSAAEPDRIHFRSQDRPAAGATATNAQAWLRARVAAGLPQVYRSTSEQFVAQMLNLDLVGGISFRKGCYTGQEIIARTQNLGRIKRRMLRFAVATGVPVAAGDSIDLGRFGAGTVIEATEVLDGACELLAVVHLDTQAEGACSDPQQASAVRELPLPYGVRDR